MKGRREEEEVVWGKGEMEIPSEKSSMDGKRCSAMFGGFWPVFYGGRKKERKEKQDSERAHKQLS